MKLRNTVHHKLNRASPGSVFGVDSDLFEHGFRLQFFEPGVYLRQDFLLFINGLERVEPLAAYIVVQRIKVLQGHVELIAFVVANVLANLVAVFCMSEVKYLKKIGFTENESRYPDRPLR